MISLAVFFIIQMSYEEQQERLKKLLQDAEEEEFEN
jgi:hypothetical protein